MSTTDYDLIRGGVESLKKLCNSDGSWGSFEGQIGNIEATSLSLLALAAAGENSYVPTRLAKAVLFEVQGDLTRVSEERNKLTQEFETRVAAECGTVVMERNQLLTENKQLKAEIREERNVASKANNDLEQAELRMSNLEREVFLLLAMRRQFSTEFFTQGLPFGAVLKSRGALSIIVLMPVLVSVALIYLLFQWPPSWWGVTAFFTVLIVAGASSSILYRWTVFRSSALGFKGEEEVFDDSELSSLRHMYMDITAELPPAIREELAYRLLTNMVAMPAEVGQRYAEELTFRIDIPTYVRSRLTGWIRYALRLSPPDRRVLFDSLLRLTK